MSKKPPPKFRKGDIVRCRLLYEIDSRYPHKEYVLSGGYQKSGACFVTIVGGPRSGSHAHGQYEYSAERFELVRRPEDWDE